MSSSVQLTVWVKYRFDTKNNVIEDVSNTATKDIFLTREAVDASVKAYDRTLSVADTILDEDDLVVVKHGGLKPGIVTVYQEITLAVPARLGKIIKRRQAAQAH